MKFKESAKGDVIKFKKVDTEVQQFSLVDNTGKMMDGKDEKKVITMVYTRRWWRSRTPRRRRRW